MIFRYAFRAISAELLKLKRTLAIKIAVVAPAVVLLLHFLVFHQRASFFAAQGDMWLTVVKNVFMLWVILMLPLFVTLETALVGGIEHTSSNWKHLFAQPIPRGAIYAGKIIAGLCLTLLSTLILWAGTVAMGYILKVLKPQLHFASTPPWAFILQHYLMSFLAVWLIVAIQTWVSARWQSFSASIGFGMTATVIGFMLINSEKWGPIYPWTLNVNFMSDKGNPAMALSIGIIGGIIAALLGGIEFTRRDVV